MVKKKETAQEEVSENVSLFELDFGREDLNKLRDKLNEVIGKLNKQQCQ